MQKIIRRLALLLTVALSVICIGIVASACKDDKKTSNYVVTVVYPDGTAVNGTTEGYNIDDEDDTQVTVQICVLLANGTTGQCFDKVELGEDGKATIPTPDYTLGDGENFKIQVNNIPEGYEYDKTEPAADNPKEVTIKLKAVAEN